MRLSKSLRSKLKKSQDGYVDMYGKRVKKLFENELVCLDEVEMIKKEYMSILV